QDLRAQSFVAACPFRQSCGIGSLGQLSLISGRGDRQNAAERLDPVGATMGINGPHHYFDRRPGSAIATHADALRKLSFAWRRSRCSRSRAFICSAISLGLPARLPLSASAFLTQSFSVLAEQPILAAIETIACQRDPCCASLSKTRRTARSRTSGENLFVVLLMMLHLTQELEPPANSVRFTRRDKSGSM